MVYSGTRTYSALQGDPCPYLELCGMPQQIHTIVLCRLVVRVSLRTTPYSVVQCTAICRTVVIVQAEIGGGLLQCLLYRGFPSSCNKKSEKRSRVQATSKDWACAVSLFAFVQLQDLGKPLYDNCSANCCRVFSPQSMHFSIVWCAVYIHFAPCSLTKQSTIAPAWDMDICQPTCKALLQ
jgi:hypothetical protein